MKGNKGFFLRSIVFVCVGIFLSSAHGASATLVGEWKSDTNATVDLDISGDLVFLANGNGGMDIVNAGNPAAPQLVGNYGRGTFIGAVAVSGNRALVLTGPNPPYLWEMQILDISNPSAPALLGRVTGAKFGARFGGFQDVAWRGSQAVAAIFTIGVVTLDVSDPANAVQQNTFTAPSIGGSTPVDYRRVNVSGNEIIYTIGPNGPFHPPLALYSSARPFWGGGGSEYVAAATAANGIGYVAISSGFRTLALSGTSAPRLLGALNSTNLGSSFPYPGDVAVSGNVAVMGRPGGVDFIEVSNPSNPRLLGSHAVPESGQRVAARDYLAFVANGTNGLKVVDFSSLVRPVIHIEIVDGAPSLQLSGKTGSQGQVEFSNEIDFATGSIQNLGDPIQLQETPQHVSDSPQTGITRRFFRLREL